MDYIKVIVSGTDEPEVQEIISQLSTYDDLLLLSGRADGGDIDVSVLTENGDTLKLGTIPYEALEPAERMYSGDIWVDLADYGVYKRDDGTCKLWVNLQVGEEKPKSFLNKSLIIGVGIVTGTLAVTAAVIKFITLYRKNKKL